MPFSSDEDVPTPAVAQMCVLWLPTFSRAVVDDI
jgi:hypothetical protein